MNRTGKGKTNRVSGVIGKAGADFKREFTLETYRQFSPTRAIPTCASNCARGEFPARWH